LQNISSADFIEKIWKKFPLLNSLKKKLKKISSAEFIAKHLKKICSPDFIEKMKNSTKITKKLRKWNFGQEKKRK
jgi:hypothetical protein